MDSLLRVEQVTKVFGRRSERALKMLAQGFGKDEILRETGATVGVHSASFTVNRGEIFVIMGLSGSGKSTLIRCINRLIEPSAGRVFLGDQDVTAADERALREIRRRRMSMVFQRFALFPHLNVAENVAYGLRVRGVPPSERRRRAMEILERVGLARWADAPIQRLSGGMQQRVGLGRAIVTDPEILLMDEPFSALDPLIRRDMQDELLRLQSDLKKTIVFITHDLDEALKLGDRVAVMKDGVIHQIGAPEEILQEPATDYVAEFVRGVSPQHVLTARHIMQTPGALVKVKDGPRVALREMEAEGLSSAFVVDEAGRLVGLVLADDAVRAISEGRRNLREIAVKDSPRVAPDTLMDDLLPIAAEARYPIAVVDDDGRLLGIIARVHVLSGLVAHRREPADGRKPGEGA
ncbi:MAG: glycine betaine/L-proline ABC transporter ATP-binding protein [Firmicutes bacterium]|nr:glycine betaine/L-proline ABC transporter ATP-binding protein [Bacillota bacterium]